MQTELYAPNTARRLEAFIRSGGRCENYLPSGERCPVRLGGMRITHSYELQYEQLIFHHKNNDPENPDAELLYICWACHMRLHRKPGPGRKRASARKTGYKAVRIAYLLEQLAGSGFRTWLTTDGRTAWQIGPLQSEATDSIEAITMALHWQASEIRDLESRLQQLQESFACQTT